MSRSLQYKVFAGDEMEIRLPDEQAAGEVNISLVVSEELLLSLEELLFQHQ